MNALLDLFDQAERAPEICAVISFMAQQGETDRGAVFTRPEVVDAILDLSGYRSDRPVHRMRLLEPSFGAGDFLLAVVRRLWTAFLADGGRVQDAATELSDAIVGVELHSGTFESTKKDLQELLVGYGVSIADAGSLCNAWLVCDDFLLSPLSGGFDFVVGNPPYVRQERIPPALLGKV